ncbi:MAG: RNA polymerase sigma-70 factor [Bacteroidales bacterium]|nr:RNA polymerase sigma-70 factor [Bacteroidales bacterium]
MKKDELHKLNADSKFLINRLRRGEEAAYELLFKEYYQVLTVFARRYLNDLEAAKEVVQDLFVSLYEKREQLDINSSLKSYLFRSTHNRCINQLNAQKIRHKYVEYANYNTDIRDNSLEDEVNRTELEHHLYKAISELPPKCRSIFKMNRFEGLSNGEIAERMNLSKRTVETQISKALRILRGKMEPYTSLIIPGLFIEIIRLLGS